MVYSTGRKTHFGRRMMPWSLSRNCAKRRRRETSTTVWTVTVSSAGGSASTTAGQKILILGNSSAIVANVYSLILLWSLFKVIINQVFPSLARTQSAFQYYQANLTHVWWCLLSGCVGVPSVTTAAVTQWAPSRAATESAVACSVTTSTVQWLSATHRRKWQTTPEGHLSAARCKLGEL